MEGPARAINVNRVGGRLAQTNGADRDRDDLIGVWMPAASNCAYL